LVSNKLTMGRRESDRRDSLVARLAALRDDDRLTSAIVREAARAAGVHERTVWRWLAAGRYEPGKRTGWRATPAAVEAAEAVIEQRREAAREMGRRKAAASRKARTRIAPLTATGPVQDITAIIGDGRRREPSLSNARTDQALRVLGLADRLNTAIPSAREAET
jgi:hypothetical protein